jgi:hypothetical protein
MILSFYAAPPAMILSFYALSSGDSLLLMEAASWAALITPWRKAGSAIWVKARRRSTHSRDVAKPLRQFPEGD